MNKSIRVILRLAACVSVLGAPLAAMAQTPVATLTIAAGGFQAPVTVAAGTTFQINVINASPSGVELDGVLFATPSGLSSGTSAVFTLGPLAPGRYVIIDDLHPTAAPGIVIAQ
jgi:Cupredoxin-like domain